MHAGNSLLRGMDERAGGVALHECDVFGFRAGLVAEGGGADGVLVGGFFLDAG